VLAASASEVDDKNQKAEPSFSEYAKGSRMNERHEVEEEIYVLNRLWPMLAHKSLCAGVYVSPTPK